MPLYNPSASGGGGVAEDRVGEIAYMAGLVTDPKWQPCDGGEINESEFPELAASERVYQKQITGMIESLAFDSYTNNTTMTHGDMIGCVEKYSDTQLYLSGDGTQPTLIDLADTTQRMRMNLYSGGSAITGIRNICLAPELDNGITIPAVADYGNRICYFEIPKGLTGSGLTTVNVSNFLEILPANVINGPELGLLDFTRYGNCIPVYMDGQFVVFGMDINSDINILTSYDGMTWEYHGKLTDGSYLRHVSPSDGGGVVVSATDTILYFSSIDDVKMLNYQTINLTSSWYNSTTPAAYNSYLNKWIIPTGTNINFTGTYIYLDAGTGAYELRTVPFVDGKTSVLYSITSAGSGFLMAMNDRNRVIYIDGVGNITELRDITLDASISLSASMLFFDEVNNILVVGGNTNTAQVAKYIVTAKSSTVKFRPIVPEAGEAWPYIRAAN